MYTLLETQLETMAAGEEPALSRLCNILALLYNEVPAISWCGLYLYQKDAAAAWLGPFQGKPACLLIPLGKGVVGTALATRTIQNVPDVHAFKGHIACDSASRSELVIPLEDEGKLLGVLDLDSDQPAAFEPALQQVCEKAAALLAPLVVQAFFPASKDQ